ncbi:MAG: DNA polymerase III subunit gamma/tau [Candidatus Gastranaerophilales bacterium]|nr:DNA polymerase III subunit gamma/tau [Candidatus Gastranaerophilales bacterium]
MTETVLYRKYRPQKFKEILGQDHIIKVLESSIENGNIAQAYIFAGSRGTGKTSAARIFAKEIGTTINDISEIDAASNTGVDDIRALNDSVNTLPFESKYKVYILDEAHMLSKSAWNALLKTIEEPPRHVVFILATTEVNKIPETIISRCQTFSFKKPTQKVLKEVVSSIAKKEGFSLETSSADLIALLGDGSFRDAQSILQKVMSASKDKKISPEEVELVTGAPKSELVNDFIRAIDENNLELGLGVISKATEANIDTLIYFKLVLHKMRSVLLLRNLKSSEEKLQNEMTDTDFNFIKGLALKKSSKINSETLLILLSYYDMVAKSYIPELPLELVLTKLIS